MTQESKPMSEDDRIYHITTRADWNHALATGKYELSTRGKSFLEVGFIHASLYRQIVPVKEYLYGDCDEELVLLVMSLTKLRDEGLTVLFESAENGEIYPHIYSPLACRLVDEVRRIGN